MRSLIILGKGGHCRACIDIIDALGYYKIEGLIISDQDSSDTTGLYPVIGRDSDLKKILNQDKDVFIGVGQIKSFQPRLRLYKLIKEYGAKLPTIISPRAFCSKRSSGPLFISSVTISSFNRPTYNRGCWIKSIEVILTATGGYHQSQ